MTNEAIFASIINDKNNLNQSIFNGNYRSNGYRNNHDSTKNNNDNNSNMINSKNDTTIRSQSNLICAYTLKTALANHSIDWIAGRSVYTI